MGQQGIATGCLAGNLGKLNRFGIFDTRWPCLVAGAQHSKVRITSMDAADKAVQTRAPMIFSDNQRDVVFHRGLLYGASLLPVIGGNGTFRPEFGQLKFRII